MIFQGVATPVATPIACKKNDCGGHIAMRQELRRGDFCLYKKSLYCRFVKSYKNKMSLFLRKLSL